MTPKSVHETFKLSSLAHDAPWDAPIIHPLELVAGNGCSPPLLVISYDYADAHAPNLRNPPPRFGRRKKADQGNHKIKGRIDMGVERMKTHFTHCNLTIIPGAGEKPICASFGAACLAEIPKDGKFQFLHPDIYKGRDMHKERAIFATLDKMDPVKCVASSAVEYEFVGKVVSEGWRHCDIHMTTRLTDAQVKRALETIRLWTEEPPSYALRPVRGKNCRNLVTAVLDATGVRKPGWWNSLKLFNVDLPWWDTVRINSLSQGKLTTYGNWLLQPPAVTREMLDAMQPTVAERKRIILASEAANQPVAERPLILPPSINKPEELAA